MQLKSQNKYSKFDTSKSMWYKEHYTGRNILEDFQDFPLWEYTIASFKQKLSIKRSDSVLPEWKIQEMFY